MTQPRQREHVRFLVFSASLRRESLNARLAELAERCIRVNGGEADLASMADFDCPSYDQDDQIEHGFPDGAEEFKRRLESCDGFVILIGFTIACKECLWECTRCDPSLVNFITFEERPSL